MNIQEAVNKLVEKECEKNVKPIREMVLKELKIYLSSVGLEEAVKRDVQEWVNDTLLGCIDDYLTENEQRKLFRKALKAILR